MGLVVEVIPDISAIRCRTITYIDDYYILNYFIDFLAQNEQKQNIVRFLMNFSLDFNCSINECISWDFLGRLIKGIACSSGTFCNKIIISIFFNEINY